MAFDLTVHRRNAKGEIVATEPYRLEINQGQRRYERPVNSGIWYSEDGNLLPESVLKLKELEDQKKNLEMAKAAKVAKEAQEMADLKAKAAQAEAALAENARMQAKIAELEKRAKS